MASLKDPALRTCSQVKVVRLATVLSQQESTAAAKRGTLTAERSDGSVNWLHECTLTVQLVGDVSKVMPR